MSSFFGGFEKKAWMEMHDLEAAQGEYIIPEKHKAFAEKRLEEEKSKSFALRHPFLTGVPTLGIWPGVAHGKASKRILGDIYRRDPGYLHSINQAEHKKLEEERQHEIATQELRKAEREAQARERMMATGATAALSGLDSYLRSKQREREDKE